jgi:hypothetical protein
MVFPLDARKSLCEQTSLSPEQIQASGISRRFTRHANAAGLAKYRGTEPSVRGNSPYEILKLAKSDSPQRPLSEIAQL